MLVQLSVGTGREVEKTKAERKSAPKQYKTTITGSIILQTYILTDSENL